MKHPCPTRLTRLAPLAAHALRLLPLLPLLPLLVASGAWAEDGHDHAGHDHGAPAASASGPAWPRFVASSELFELVGVLNGRQLTLYLDHADSNAPVQNAQLELELDGQRITLTRHAEGEFEATLAKLPALGLIPITATVSAPQGSDLLAGELELLRAGPDPAPGQADAHGAEAPPRAPRWPAYAGALAGGLLLLAILRRWLRQRPSGPAAAPLTDAAEGGAA